MACQGCGRSACENRLCCPTCIEFGRTSYFCGQECFTSNWKQHSQLHVLLKRQRLAEQPAENGHSHGNNGSSSSNGPSTNVERGRPGPMDPLPRTTQPLPRAQMEDIVGSSGSRGRRGQTPPPLPGGTSLRSHFARGGGGGGGGRGQAAPASGSTSKKTDAPGAPSGPGIFGSLVGKAQALLGSGGGSSASSSSTPTGPPGGAKAAGSASAAQANATAAKPPKRSFAKTALASLATFALLTGAVYYLAFQQYAPDEAPIAMGVDASDLLAVQQSSSGVASGGIAAAAGVAAGVLSSAASVVAAPAAPQPTVTIAASELGALKAEVEALREGLARHDKMIRYVMDRYVEKEGGRSALGPDKVVANGADAEGVKLAALEVLPKNEAGSAGLGNAPAEHAASAEALHEAWRRRRHAESEAMGMGMEPMPGFSAGAQDVERPPRPVGQPGLESALPGVAVSLPGLAAGGLSPASADAVAATPQLRGSGGSVSSGAAGAVQLEGGVAAVAAVGSGAASSAGGLDTFSGAEAVPTLNGAGRMASSSAGQNIASAAASNYSPFDAPSDPAASAARSSASAKASRGQEDFSPFGALDNGLTVSGGAANAGAAAGSALGMPRAETGTAAGGLDIGAFRPEARAELR
eukprot:TRINITY_DN19073_c0_g1_i1.p1 TRINITY_DN19073_c0_g1~~TRINITY_DN19073_c0_g1_i1.p1  ORF type:complete len:637 (+),score=156.13 TRINITY_DN19073_c0_g1_i1:212-2122(+)